MTDLSKVKEKILEALSESKAPLSSKEISNKTGLQPPSLIKHLKILKNEALVTALEGNYTITAKGKEKLGLLTIDRMKAEKILSRVPMENAFSFYADIDQPLGISSDSLNDLCDKLKSVDARSIEFHTTQGHLESWTTFLGDIELSKRLKLIKDANLKGKALREMLHKTIKSRLDELQKIKSQ